MKGRRFYRELVFRCNNVRAAILQRVASASVTVDKQLVTSIGKGVLVFAAVGPDDTRKDAESLASKVLKLKLWPDESGNGVSIRWDCKDHSLILFQWKNSVQDIGGEVLCGVYLAETATPGQLTWDSIAIHLVRVNEKGKQARLSRCSKGRPSSRTVRVLFRAGPGSLQRTESKKWCLPSHDGSWSCKRWTCQFMLDSSCEAHATFSTSC